MKVKTLLQRFMAALMAMLMAMPVKAAEVVTYFHNDVSGSPMIATDASGAVLWKETYKPYGDKLYRQPASAANKIGFHGKPFDDNSGLSYMSARYYDPVIGRFMGIDPVDFQEDNLHSFNRYAYANNNPYKYVDPDGRFGQLVIRAIMPWLRVLLGAAAQAGSNKPGGGDNRTDAEKDEGVPAQSPRSGGADTGGADKGPTIHEGQQGKHVPGHNNFQPGKSELTDPNPQGLLDQGAGTGQQVGNVPLGQPGSKERVDFGRTIGTYVDPVTGQRSPTTIGIIHNGSRGSHIVPARPGS